MILYELLMLPGSRSKFLSFFEVVELYFPVSLSNNICNYMFLLQNQGIYFAKITGIFVQSPFVFFYLVTRSLSYFKFQKKDECLLSISSLLIILAEKFTQILTEDSKSTQANRRVYWSVSTQRRETIPVLLTVRI